MRSISNHRVYSVLAGALAILAASVALGTSAGSGVALLGLGSIGVVTVYMVCIGGDRSGLSPERYGRPTTSALAARRRFGKTALLSDDIGKPPYKPAVMCADAESAQVSAPSRWVQYPAKSEVSLGQHIFVIGAAQSPFANVVMRPLTRAGYSLDVLDCFDTALASLRELPQFWNFVFIDLDELEERWLLDEILVELLQLRREFSQIPIALISSDFAADEFGTHRLQVADLCLAKPVATERVLSSLSIMSENNRAWNDRLSMPSEGVIAE